MGLKYNEGQISPSHFYSFMFPLKEKLLSSFLVLFLSLFSQKMKENKNNSFYIEGESEAWDHYIPLLSILTLKEEKF